MFQTQKHQYLRQKSDGIENSKKNPLLVSIRLISQKMVFTSELLIAAAAAIVHYHNDAKENNKSESVRQLLNLITS